MSVASYSHKSKYDCNYYATIVTLKAYRAVLLFKRMEQTKKRLVCNMTLIRLCHALSV